MTIPAGTLAFSGFGQAPMAFTAPDGTAIAAPSPAPKVGDPAVGLANDSTPCSPNFNGLTSCEGVVALDDGTFCITGTTYCLAGVGVVDYATLAPSLDPASRQGTDILQGLRSIATGYGNGHFYGLRIAASLDPDPTYAIWAVDAAGLHGASYSLGFNHFPWDAAIGVTEDASVGYYLEHQSSVVAGRTDTVLRADLVGGTTTFTTETGFHSTVNGLLVLRNGDVLVGWQKASAAGDVKHYSAAGTLLHTYALPGTVPSPVVLTPGVDDTTFWVSYYNTTVPTFSGVTVAEIEIGAGTIVHSFAPEVGTFQFDGPFCVLRAGTAPPIPPAPPGAIEPIRRLRQAPHLWDGTSGHRLKYPGFQLLVEAGAPRDTDGPMSWVLQWSDDGGHSWSHEHRIEGSRLGEHTFRFWWRRLGQSRDRVFRVVNSDDAKIVVIDALLVPDPIEGSS